ncbi:MAG: DUF1284 domain-containing protein, partial [Deltaproteobacteria bacterium]|nr:DUF1284 domain-containing protein [Deltaproteobacteria bacterium]
GRGLTFADTFNAIKKLLQSDSDTIIELIEGVDGLCLVCPECKKSRCENRQGNEDAVRKLDRVVLKGLGIAYGDQKTVRQLQTIITNKAPLSLCRTRCQWRNRCNVFELTNAARAKKS